MIRLKGVCGIKKTAWFLARMLFIMLVMQQTSYASSGNPKWCKVEILVFANDTSKITQESWPLDKNSSPIHQGVNLKPTGETTDEFMQLPPKALSLTDAKQRLQQTAGKKILLHTGWRQILVDKNGSSFVHLTGGGSLEPKHEEAFKNGSLREIEGTIRVSLSRFLHVDADLLYRKKMTVPAQNSGDPSSTFSSKTPSQKIITFRLTDTAKLRSNEAHYFDHPLYGVLVLVSPETTEPPKAEGA